jgi:hypothetical protein
MWMQFDWTSLVANVGDHGKPHATQAEPALCVLQVATAVHVWTQRSALHWLFRVSDDIDIGVVLPTRLDWARLVVG